jgi:VWFA-related protein
MARRLHKELVMTRLLVPSIALSLAAGLTPAVPAAPTERTVYVTVTDAKRAPILDLTADDFSIKEDGKTREITKAEIATSPLRIAVIIDDNGTGIFRPSAGAFMQRLLGKAEFSLSSVTGQVMKLVDYTGNANILSEGLAKIAVRAATNDGGQLLSGIYEAAKEIEAKKPARPVILALTVGGEEHSPLPAHHVLDQLRKSGAGLYVVSVAASAIRSTAAVNNPAELLGENMNKNEVIGDGPKQSGGRHDEIVAAPGIVQAVQQLAEELASQYKLTYVLPDGVKPNEKLTVTTRRKGAVLRAPTRVPDK